MSIEKRIADIIREANKKFWPEGVHPDTMGEIIARELGLYVEMCDEPDCVLAAGHPPGKHLQHRQTMLACPHNIPNFGPECPICDINTTQLGARQRYQLYGNPNGRDRRTETIELPEPSEYHDNEPQWNAYPFVRTTSSGNVMVGAQNEYLYGLNFTEAVMFGTAVLAAAKHVM